MGSQLLYRRHGSTSLPNRIFTTPAEAGLLKGPVVMAAERSGCSMVMSRSIAMISKQGLALRPVPGSSNFSP